jgi:hypothetical protein
MFAKMMESGFQKKGNHYVSNTDYEQYVACEKVDTIMNHIEEIMSKNSKLVLYSNFDDVMKCFSALLSHRKIAHVVLEKGEDVVLANQTDVILLAPNLYEGISLMKIQYLLVIEPISIPMIRDQLIARARRFRSHYDLDESQKFVEVRDYIWQQPRLLYETDPPMSMSHLNELPNHSPERVAEHLEKVDQLTSISRKYDIGISSFIMKVRQLTKSGPNKKMHELFASLTDTRIADSWAWLNEPQFGFRERVLKSAEKEAFVRCVNIGKLRREVETSIQKNGVENSPCNLPRKCTIFTPQTNPSAEDPATCLAQNQEEIQENIEIE